MNHICRNCGKEFDKKGYTSHLLKIESCQKTHECFEVLNRKSGVYAVKTPLENLESTKLILKIGMSANIQSRLTLEKTFICFDRNYMVNNVKWIAHSRYYETVPDILESIIHYILRKNRVRKRKEFFCFPLEENIVEKIRIEIEKIGIPELSFYYDLDSVPLVEIPVLKFQDEKKIEKLEPREQQKPVIEKLSEHFIGEERGGLYQPPGIGKTYTTVLFLMKHDFRRILVLTPSISISDEWKKCVDHTNMKSILVTSHDEHRTFIRKQQMVITTYQNCLDYSGEKIALHKEYKDFDFVVYDEAHHVTRGNDWGKTLKIKGKKLFLTATPSVVNFENGKVTISDMDEETYGKVIYHLTVHDSIEEGYLTPYRFVIHNQPSNTDCSKHVKILRKKYGRKKIVVFYNTIKNAKKAVKSVPGSYYVDGKTTGEERREIFRKFEEDKTAVLINVKVVSEGVSIPCIDCVLIMENRNSKRDIMQILGRGLRLYKGKLSCIFAFPQDCKDAINNALSTLYFDIKQSKKVKTKNILEKMFMYEGEIKRKRNRNLARI